MKMVQSLRIVPESGNPLTAEDTALIVSEGSKTDIGIALQTLVSEAQEHIENSRAENTRRAYRSDWEDFTVWCRHQGLSPLPASPETVALYLTDCAKGLKPSTLQRRMASISQAHAAAGHTESPIKSALVRSVWRGIRRDKGVAPQGKAPALTADIRVMVNHLPQGKLLGIRDRALLLLGFAGAMRRSELVGLDVEDVLETEEGLVVTIRRSKTDQEGMGRKIGIPYGSHPPTCPVRTLRAWKSAAALALAKQERKAEGKARNAPENNSHIYKEGEPPFEGDIAPLTGPLFRAVDRHGNVSRERLSDQSVARVVKRALKAAGRDAEAVAKFAGHSLRAGLATSAAMAGASERSIQDQTGHKSLTILRRYIRDGSLFRENATATVGL
jgi:site-specific recombinase XerD